MDQQRPENDPFAVQSISIDQRITVVKGFAHSHRTGDDAQITHGVSVLLANLSAGARVSDALINAEAAYNNAKRMPRRRITINRRLASASSKAQPSALQC